VFLFRVKLSTVVIYKGFIGYMGFVCVIVCAHVCTFALVSMPSCPHTHS